MKSTTTTQTTQTTPQRYFDYYFSNCNHNHTNFKVPRKRVLYQQHYSEGSYNKKQKIQCQSL